MLMHLGLADGVQFGVMRYHVCSSEKRISSAYEENQ